MSGAAERKFFSLVVLGFGSGKFLIPFVERLHELFLNCPFEWEIILVGNYSSPEPDETARTVLELAARFDRVIPVVQPKQGMAGWDLRQGMALAEGEYIGFIDGDGQNPVESVFECLEKIHSENLDLVKTFRISREDGFFRSFVSSVYNALFRILFKTHYRDINSNPKIILRSKYEQMELKSSDWFFDAEIMLRAAELGLKVGEVPIRFRALNGRNSFVNLGTIFEFMINLYKYRFGRDGGKYVSCDSISTKLKRGMSKN
ncbi:MAG: glycosyltransferase family 2 protein [bacterium]